MADRIQLRRDTASNWTNYNPILLEGESGIELDTDQWKLGDGIHNWNDLPYRGGPYVQQRGQSTTAAMSQKAVTDELDIIDDKINVLAAGVSVTLAISPNIIYKGYSQPVMLTGRMINGTPSKMELLDGSTVLAESTSSPITRSDLAVNITDNSKTFGVRGTVNGITINNTATLNARYPIYYGFGENASAVAISSNRYAATTTAAHTYEKTASVSGQHFFILVPSDISALSNFSMGGAPFVMTSSTATIDGVTYKVYTSGNTYNSGTKLTVVAS